MKIKLLLISVLGSLLLPLDGRTLTSADGEKTIEVELIDYRPATDTVVFRYAGSRARQSAKASVFSEEDRAYFVEFAKEQAMRNSLRLDAAEEKTRTEDAGDLYTYTRQESFFRVSVRNAGQVTVEDLTAKYDIYLQRHDGDDGRGIEVVSGEVALDPVSKVIGTEFETQTVKVTLDCKTSSSCPTCVSHAGSVKRERVLGLRVRICNSEGAELTEFHSSNSVRAIAEKEDERRSG